MTAQIEAEPLDAGAYLIQALDDEGELASCAFDIPLAEGTVPSCEDGTYLTILDGDDLQGWFVHGMPESVEIVLSLDDAELASQVYEDIEWDTYEYNLGCDTASNAEVSFSL
ncbi:MAG: hypothetical protein GY913_30620 [Proteobacteria bacterium]|nr:hypothetical protein [Pseudomonadota bacterium]MCP4921272.1 hypothetical protein [Pseudomonadota bacterium]